MQELVDAIQKHMTDSGSYRLRFVDSLNILREEKELCKIFAGENGDTEALAKIIRVQTDTYMDSEYMDAINGLPEIKRTAIKLMAVSAITTTIKVWIDYGMQSDPQAVADTMGMFILGGLGSFIHKQAD